MGGLNIQIQEVPWTLGREAIHPIRYAVFIHEQGVSEQDEWDHHDESSTHFVATHGETGEPVGTTRLLPCGKITRMAVLKPWRSQGVGSALLVAATNKAHALQLSALTLDAQLGAVAFYERHGFKASGPVFMDAGIEHRKMSRQL